MNELKGVGMVDKTICRVQKWCLAKNSFQCWDSRPGGNLDIRQL